MTDQPSDQLTCLVQQYLGLESMEVTEELLELCGAALDTRALSLLRHRLNEEEAHIPILEMRGYIRMREKCEQLVRSLKSLIVHLENMEQDKENMSSDS